MPILTTEDAEIRATPGLHVYHALLSNCSMRVRLLLGEKSIPWTSHEMNLGRQENLEDWYLAINPKGLVPAIVHDGVVVTESNDILDYLEEKFPEPPFTPSEPESQHRMRDWVERASSLHVQAMKTYVYGKTGARTKRAGDMTRYRELQPDAELVEFHQKTFDGFKPEEVERAEQLNHEILAEMEDVLSHDPWLAGDSYSLADIAWLPNIVLLQMLGFPLGRYPHVTKWIERVQARPAYGKAVGRALPKVPFWLMRAAMKVRGAFR
jgi:glutathione S-transferase